MKLETVFNYNDSISFLKNHFLDNYRSFIEDFINYKTSGENFFSYVKIDNYAIVTITTIYNLDEYLDWARTNNLEIKEFKY